MRSRSNLGVQLSIVDHLIDTRLWEHRKRPYPMLSRADSIRALRHSVADHVQSLLNTTRPDDVQEHLQNSIFNYGLPDLTQFHIPGDEGIVVGLIREAIERFEPRIAPGFRITPMPSPDRGRQTLCFLIEGMLLIEPSPEPIAITTELVLTTSQNKVAEQA